MSLTVGSLFAGIGGFDLAADWLGWETLWFSEIDPYAIEVFRAEFPSARNVGDITTVDWADVPYPDIVCGGFPCQDTSTAGKRVGIGGARSGLWREFARAIRELRPRYVVVENGTGLLHRGMGDVLGDLAKIGYDAEWEVLSASDVGAPHARARVWLVAYPNGEQLGQRGPSEDAGRARRCWPADARRAPKNDCGEWAGTDQPPVLGMAHGIPGQMDRNKCLGNAVMPQCALEGPFRRILELEAER